MNAQPKARKLEAGSLPQLRELRDKLRDAQLKLDNEISLREKGQRGHHVREEEKAS